MNSKATLGAFVTMCIVTLVGVLSWFRPIEEADEVSIVLLPSALNLLVYALLSVLLFDWVARRMESAYAAALAIGAAKYILVIDLTLRGERGIATAGASAVLLTVTWVGVAYVYTLFSAIKRTDSLERHNTLLQRTVRCAARR